MMLIRIQEEHNDSKRELFFGVVIFICSGMVYMMLTDWWSHRKTASDKGEEENETHW
jgi:hypothetical protein